MLRTALLLSLSTLAACSNYDFARARREDGSVDMERLIADLKASGEEQLSEGTWLPLIHLDLTTFEASKSGYPPGYVLTEVSASAPVFCAGTQRKTHVDAAGVTLEVDDVRWLLWGVLWHDHEERVETPAGERVSSGWRTALVLGDDDVLYLRARATGGATQ